jgi:uncharacterized protein YacL
MIGTMMQLADIWHWITSWWGIMLSYGIAGIWVAALIAAAILIPRINLTARIVLLSVAGIIVLCTISFTVGIKKGADRVQSDWDYSIEAETKSGTKDRTDAERTVRAQSPDSVRLDPWNRDRWKKRDGAESGEGEGGALRRP